MAHEHREVPISKLYLDRENPRHKPLDNEPEIIAQLVRSERADVLAKHIAGVGAVSPIDLIAVIAHPSVPGGYVVVEGNRRVCALKLLADPSKAPNAKLKAKLESYKEGGKPIPKKIDVVVFDDEQEVMPWVSLRHQGEQGGVGIRPWDVAGKARQSQRQGDTGANHLALSAINYAAKEGLITAEEADSLAPTTLTRYLNNPVMRHTLGIASKDALDIDVPKVEFDRAIQAFLRDALPEAQSGKKPRVTSRSNAVDVKDYANKLTTEGSAPKTRLAKPTKLKASGAKAKRGPRAVDPNKRPNVITATFKYAFSNPVLARIYKELRDIPTEAFPFATAYLVRAFVEQLFHAYAKKYKIDRNADLHVVIDRCLKNVDATPAIKLAMGNSYRNALQPIRVMANDKHSRISPESFGQWVHGGAVPSRAEINARWESIEPGLTVFADRL